jgi:predicted RNase H-like nuclease
MTAADYKKPLQTVKRQEIIDSLSSHLTLPADHHAMEESADALDAVICVLAGADFARGRAHNPGNFALAEREGWIWFQANTEAG